MTPEEIISQDCERTGYRVGAVMHGILDAVQKRSAIVFQDNKTVIVLDPLKKGSHDFETGLFTVDSPIGLVRSLKNMLANEGPKLPAHTTLYGGNEDPQILRMIKQAGFPLEKADKPHFVWMAKI